MNKLLIKRLDKELPLPAFESDGAAGLDLYSTVDVTIDRFKVSLVPTGISIQIPKGYEAQVRPRSGLAAKYGITVVNSPGTIDSDYRGEIKVIMTMISNDFDSYKISRGDRIAQLVLNRIETPVLLEVDSLDDTDRGDKGFGSTGT